MANLADRIARLPRTLLLRDHPYCVQAAGVGRSRREQHGGHSLRAYADAKANELPLPLTDRLIPAHLRGQTTLAFYTARRLPDGRTLCREGIMECDDKRRIPDPTQPGCVRTVPENGLAMMRAAHGRLDRAGIPSILELSRRGARVRVVATEAVPARTMQNLLLFALGAEERVRMAQGERAVEINPKQETLAPGRVGNSVRGPFGVHLEERRTVSVHSSRRSTHWAYARRAA